MFLDTDEGLHFTCEIQNLVILKHSGNRKIKEFEDHSLN